MAIRLIASSDRGARYDGSYSRNVCDLNCGIGTFEWAGYVLVPAGSVASSLDIIIPFRDNRGSPDTVGMVLEADTHITKLSLQVLGPLQMGSAAGRLKLAPTIGEAAATQFVQSGAATAGTLNPAGFARRQNNSFAAAINSGANPVTYKVFATDGGNGAAAAPSTVTATKETKVLITICGYLFLSDPEESDIGFSVPRGR